MGEKIVFGPVKVVCGSCDGTGLYKGIAERDDCAVVCTDCDGTGCVEIMRTYEKFTERKKKEGVIRVFASSFGYVHASEDVVTKEGKLIKFSEGGCTYEEFVNGVSPKPVKELYCPYLWTHQEMQSARHPGYKFYQKHCYLADNWVSGIKDCPKYCDKAKCWALYEKMNQKSK